MSKFCVQFLGVNSAWFILFVIMFIQPAHDAWCNYFTVTWGRSLSNSISATIYRSSLSWQ